MRNNFPVQAWRNLQSQPNSPYFLFSSIDIQAQAHYNRVIADGGIMPAGLLGCNAWFVAVKAVYAVTDITTAISAGYDPHYLGAKIGAGSGTTLGQAATKLYSCSGASGDLVQATAASMPLLLVKNSTDANYYFPDASSVGCATPNAAVNQITGDIDIQFKINKKAGKNYSFSKWSGTAASASYWMYYDSGTQKVVLGYSNGSSNIEHPSSVTYTTTGILWLRATRVSSTGVVAFYFKINDSDSWTQIGANVAGASGSINVGNTTLNVANTSVFASTQEAFYRATISNSIGGTPVVDFNPASYNAATSQTQWTSTTGEVWTINTGTATTGYKSALVTKTTVIGDGIDDRMTSGTLASRQYFTRFVSISPYNLTPIQYIIAGNPPSETHLIYKGSENAFLYNTPSQITFSGTSAYNLQLLTGDYNGATSKARINAASDVAGTTGAATSTIINVFSSGSGTLFANSKINTLIDSVAVLNDTQKTAMYNVLKGFDDNAY